MFSVAENGTAQYSVPIEVPPGRAGIEPALTLRYSGTRENDDLGVGWHLDGLSQITRCPQSQALDGTVRAVKNDPADRFCLDGKRLEVVKGIDSGTVGSYGEDGTEYRTLIDSFARIVSYQATGLGIQLDPLPGLQMALRSSQGPDSFRVWTKDGRILTYGSTRDAIMMAQVGVRYGWLLSRVEDRFGNTMTFSYTNLATAVPNILADGFVNVVRPLSIFYTEQTGSPGNREVRFTYEDRGDPQIRIRQGGMPFVADQRLAHITTLVDGAEVKDYHLQYTSQTPSLIDSIYECTGTDSTAICKAPTVFRYQNQDQQKPMYKAHADLLSFDATEAAELDANGDGVPDFMVTKVKVNGVSANPLLAGIKLVADVGVGVGGSFLGGVGGIAVSTVWSLVSGPFFSMFESAPTIDVFHTMYLGKADRSPPTGVLNVQGIPCNGGSNPYFILDYDRDGKDDIAVVCGNALVFARSVGDGNFQPLPASTNVALTRNSFEGNHATVLFDIDGDSLQDVLWCEDPFTLTLQRRLSPSQGFDQPLTLVSPPPPPCNPRQVCPPPRRESLPFCGDPSPTYQTIDIDGDGTPDLLFRGPKGGMVLRYSPLNVQNQLSFEPVKFTDVGSSPYGGSVDGDRILLGDFNGDGLVDIENDTTSDHSVIWINAGAGRFWGRSVNHPQPTLKPGLDYSFRKTAIVDFDGDGRDDLLETRETVPSSACTDLSCFPSIAIEALIANSAVTTLAPPPNANFNWVSTDPDHGDKSVSFRVAADLDGDGIRDLFGYGGAVFYGQNANNLLLETVLDGVGNITRVQYDEPNAYTTDDSCSGSVWPEKCLPRMSGLVSSYREGFIGRVSGNEQIERTYSYHYLNGRVNVTGLGWLGFDQKVNSRTSSAGSQEDDAART